MPTRVTDSFALNPPSWTNGTRPKTAPKQRQNADQVRARPHSAPPEERNDIVIGSRVCVLLNGQRCLGSVFTVNIRIFTILR